MTALVEAGLATLMATHHAFRRDLDRLVSATAALNPSPSASAEPSGEGAQAAAAAIQEYWSIFERELLDHHRVEDEEVFVQVGSVLGDDAKSVLDEMESEHERLTAATERARAAVDALAADPEPGQASTAQAAVTELRGITNSHLEHEESDCIPLVRRAFDDQYMAGFLGRRQASAVMPEFLPWLVDGVPDEAAAHLTAMLPPPVQALLRDQWQPARRALIDRLP